MILRGLFQPHLFCDSVMVIEILYTHAQALSSNLFQKPLQFFSNKNITTEAAPLTQTFRNILA